MNEIREGLLDGVNVEVYAKPDFDAVQMFAIRMGLKEGQPVSVYCNPKFNGNQMLAILNGLERGVDTTLYSNPKICQEKMRIILYGPTEDKDVSYILMIDLQKLFYALFYKALKLGYDLAPYIKVGISVEEIRGIISSLEHGRKPNILTGAEATADTVRRMKIVS